MECTAWYTGIGCCLIVLLMLFPFLLCLLHLYTAILAKPDGRFWAACPERDAIGDSVSVSLGLSEGCFTSSY